MAFSFADIASGLSSSGDTGVKVQDGPELAEIQTDQLGFTGVNGEARIKLLPRAWPADDLPIPSASLLSIASSQGLLAAGGPNCLVIARTEDVRSTLQETSQENTRDLKPFLTINHSRLAHVAFSSDESCLVVAEQESHFLLVYEVEKLKEGKTEPTLQLATNGMSLRTVVANPAVQSAQLFACITADGDLLIADLSNGSLVEGPDGVVLVKNATSASWSNKGKQLVVGLSDGTASQIKPNGTIVAQIPKSTAVSEGMHISGISWLENDSFFVIYTPNSTDTDQGVPPSEYFVVTRAQKQYTFSKLPEILPPFGLERVPTFHYITRLRDWQPHITDLLLLSSTTATEIGMISKSTKALSSSDSVVDAFTFTTTDEDTRRASLPLSSDLDTSPIGMALDLSAKNGVVNPIPADPEIEETSGPAPNIMVLNNEGILCSWWIIYNDSVRQKTTFSGFANLGTMEEARAAASPKPDSSTPPLNLPPVSSQAQVPPLAAPKSIFGQTGTSGSSSLVNSSSTFGTGSSFGSVSKIGGEKSSWTSTGFSTATGGSTSGGSAFGQSTFGQPGFGSQSSAFGTTSLPQNQATTSVAPAFGQTGFGQTPFGSKPAASAFGANSTLSSPFAAAAGSSNKSGFSSFAGTGGFASASAETATKSSSPFGQVSNTSSPFGQPSSSNAFSRNTPFGAPPAKAEPSAFGKSFKLESSFKGDGTAKDDLPKPQAPSNAFGSSFGDLLNSTASGGLSPTRDREEVMGDDGEDGSGSEATATDRPSNALSFGQRNEEAIEKSMITPPSTISQSKATPAPPVSSLFGSSQANTTTPQPLFGGASWSFGNNTSTTPKDNPTTSNSIFGKPLAQQSKDATAAATDKPLPDAKESKSIPKPEPKIKIEPQSDDDEVIGTPREPPLPPDPMSRPDFQAGDTSTSSVNSSKPDDAPLPPDFVPANKSALSKEESIALPAGDDEDEDHEEYSSDFEDSGEDVTQDISPADEGDDEDEDDAEHEEDEDHAGTEPLSTSPESSFKDEHTSNTVASPTGTGGFFTKVSSTQPAGSTRPLFGEIGTSAPSFPPPKQQESPRSPSPVRNLLSHDTLQSNSRSVSAPVHARSAIDQRKYEYLQSHNAAQAAQARQEEAAKERARLESIAKAQEQARASEMRSLEHDEDTRIQHELSQPLYPSETLGAFITYEPVARGDSAKIDIPSQIERLYQDINSMIYTLGINARSLGSFLLYQKQHPKNPSWPAILESDTPLDTLNDEWFLQDIERLREGSAALDNEIAKRTVVDVANKLEICQHLLSDDLVDLRARVTAVRRSIYATKSGDEATSLLSAEQSAVQHDLRAAASKVQTTLVAAEDGLSLLRARLADLQPPDNGGRRRDVVANSPKKPTVEAVTNTIAKMTSMAEKRSADVDVLEGQLRKLGLNSDVLGRKSEDQRPSTPQRSVGLDVKTPASGASSVFYTPESKTGGSARSLRSIKGMNGARGLNMVSMEDKQRWQATMSRKKEVAGALRTALLQRQSSKVV